MAFCHALGIDYVSCSPYRVPIARLAAAQAAIQAADAGKGARVARRRSTVSSSKRSKRLTTRKRTRR